MRVYLQWTLAQPTGWQALDLRNDSDWRSLPSKPVPVGGEVIDQQPGWTFDLEIGGVHGLGSIDHSAVLSLPGPGLRVVRWEDDPEDFPDGWKRAEVWDFLPPTFDPGKVTVPETSTIRGSATLARLAKLGLRDAGHDPQAFMARIATEPGFPSSAEQRALLWEAALEVEPRSRLVTEYRTDGAFREPSAQHLEWGQFVPPVADMTRHGINVTDPLAEAHAAARGPVHGWHHWVEP